MEWHNGTFIIQDTDEDIHSANERRLSELIGDPAKKLHAGRSRNDQTLTDTKLWLRKSIDELSHRLIKFTEVLVDRANAESCILMPGYTHLQRAQPVKWSQWLLSYAWYLKADFERLNEIRKRVNALPLGSGAIAGNPFNVDRSFLASQLNFDRITENSMYTVGDRDFVAEFLFWSSLTSVHLSRLSEDLIIYSTDEFSFVRLADEYATGSSLMPQKRNPDSLEIVRGKSGTLLGRCMGFMATLKGIPSTYNKDLQEDKEALFSTFDTIRDMLVIAEGVVRTLKLNENKCREALTLSMLATDVAYYLVKKGMPFREAHHVAGQVVVVSEYEGVEVCSLSLEQLKKISCRFEEDVMQIWDFGKSVEQYQVTGGTSEAAIDKQISSLRNWLKSHSID